MDERIAHILAPLNMAQATLACCCTTANYRIIDHLDTKLATQVY